MFVASQKASSTIVGLDGRLVALENLVLASSKELDGFRACGISDIFQKTMLLDTKYGGTTARIHGIKARTYDCDTQVKISHEVGRAVQETTRPSVS